MGKILGLKNLSLRPEHQHVFLQHVKKQRFSFLVSLVNVLLSKGFCLTCISHVCSFDLQIVVSGHKAAGISSGYVCLRFMKTMVSETYTSVSNVCKD